MSGCLGSILPDALPIEKEQVLDAEDTDIIDDELDDLEDAPPHDIGFTKLERRAAEAFIILQRRIAKLGYVYLRDEIERRAELEKKDG